jgi:hypothetical protein
MKVQKILFIVLVVSLLASSAMVEADDFDWMNDFNVRAEASQSGFRGRLATRFTIGDTQIKVVLSNVERPADAYMVLRLAEMSAKPTEYVVKRYKAKKGKGWGALAKSLGIKPGSKEFHALKRGSGFYRDFHDDKDEGKGKKKHKGKSKRKGKG